MVSRWPVRAVVGLALALAVASCGDGEAEHTAAFADESEIGPSNVDLEDDAEAGPAAEDNATPDDALTDEGSGTGDAADAAEEDDPYAIPEDGIDEVYVERVLEAIYKVNREALVLTLDAEPGLVPVEAESRLRSIYGSAYGALQYQALSEVANSQDLRDSFRDPAGPLASEVLEVVDVDSACITIRVRDDFAAVLREPPEQSEGFLALALREADSDSRGTNPTPWVIVDGALNSAEGMSCG
jgi:hypothetical protein